MYSQGGGGTSYEFEVQTAFMIQFLIGGTVPGMSGATIESIRFQSGSLGYETDDLLLGCTDSSGNKSKCLLQIKHHLTISEKNSLFTEVLESSWKDFTNKKLFKPQTDKIYIVKSNLTLDEKRHLEVICNWARVKATAADFINEVERIAAKKSYLEMFRNILKVQCKVQATDEELLQFFYCLDFLEYDFGEASSTSKANFLTLIHLAKQPAKTENAEQIWDTIFTFVSHADNKGGSFNITNPPAALAAFFKKEHYSAFQKSLLNLSRQSFEIIESIKESIGDVVLERPDYLDRIITSVINQSITIITGEPGSGKSVLAKQFIHNISRQGIGFVLVFKADELNKINFRDYFQRFNIHLTIKEIFSSFPLAGNHYIYIDSMEKLLEGDGDAFKQLQQVCTPESGIKIIATCRQAELPLIGIKYLSANKVEPVKVNLLSDEELDGLQQKLPAISAILKNKRIYSLLRTPKYLDFAYIAQQQSGSDFSGSDEPLFMQQLWSIIVEKKLTGNTPGLPEKRNKQFIEVAVQRAKKMMPYVIPDNPDPEALALLERDGVIIKSSQTDAFAPAHDILEDWALIKHTDKIFFQEKVPQAFFGLLGKEPAMRRAFRLWTLQALKVHDADKIALLTATLSSQQTENYWHEESIIALLQSPYLEKFLVANQDWLLNYEWELLTKFIHLMRTSCREYDFIDFLMVKKFVPTGESWKSIIDFTEQHKEQLPASKFDLVVQMINDWHYVLYKSENVTDISGKAGSILNYLLENHYIRQDDYYHRNDNVLLCTRLLLDCCGGNPTLIEKLIKKALPKVSTNERNDATKMRYYERIIKTILAGPESTQIAKYLPLTLLEVLRQNWFYYEEPETKERDSMFPFKSRRYSSTDHNISFGVTSEFKTDYFPSSAFQTPVYWLLKQASEETVKFIIALFNHSIESFIQTDYAMSDERSEIDIYLPDGKIIRQHGSMGLWCMFRGTGISTPYLLQSVLMALEKYLLELGREGMVQKEFFQSLIGKLISESKTISLTAVVSSVAQAYPEMAGKWVVCLFSSRKTIYWDIHRWSKDRNPTYLLQREDKRAFQWERVESDKLPHRLRYPYGLKSFIVNYCFDVREYNKEIFALLDKHRKAAGKKDWEWKKILNDIDIRKWTVTDKRILEDKIELQIEPEHKGKLKKEVEKMKEEVKDYEETSGYTHWLLQVAEKKISSDIETWRKITTYYRSLEAFHPQHHHPGMAAATGIRYFWSELNDVERQWCFDVAYSIAARMIEKEQMYDYLSFDTSPFDDDAVMSALPLLLGADEINATDFSLLLANILFANVSYNSGWYNAFLQSFSEHAWSQKPDESVQLWKVLLKFAKIDKHNPFHLPRPPAEEDAKKYTAAVDELLNLLPGEPLPINLQEVDFEHYSQWVLLKVIKLIPDVNTPEICRQFLLRLIDLLTEDTQQQREGFEREDRIDYHIQTELEEKTAKVILWNADIAGTELLQQVIEKYYQTYERNYTDHEKKRESITLFRGIIRNIIYTTDKNLPNDDDQLLQRTCHSFAITWQEFFRILIHKPSILSGDLLFLNIGWNENARHWKPLEGMTKFFKGLILLAGSFYPEAAVNLLSHIGDQTLLPEGVNVLWLSLQKNSSQTRLLSIPHIEQLVQRTYSNHLPALRKDPTLLANFITLLDQLVKEGSSDAYWIREYLISFK